MAKSDRMDLLLRQDADGTAADGDKASLLHAIGNGDEVALFIDCANHPEWILFNGFALAGNEAFGTCRRHLGGNKDGPKNDAPVIMNYCYGTDATVCIFRQFMHDGSTKSVRHERNKNYLRYSWYRTRRFQPASRGDVATAPPECKFRLDIGGLTYIGRPDIVYFPVGTTLSEADPNFSLKSEEFVIPGFLAAPITSCEPDVGVSLLFNLNTDSSFKAVVQRRFTLDRKHYKYGWLRRPTKAQVVPLEGDVSFMTAK